MIGDGEARPARPRVAVAGLGDTGVIVATHLGRRFDVLGVSTRPALVSGQELGNRLTSPESWRRHYLVPFGRFRRLDRARLLHGRITGLDPRRSQLEVELADGSSVAEPYDFLVIASGVTNGFWRHGRVEGTAELESGFGSVAAQIDAARTLAVVGGGATGVSVAANLARHHRDTAVHLFVSGDEPLPGYHPRVRRSISAELVAAGVELHTGHRARVPEGFTGDRLTTDPVEWTTGQEPFAADATLWAVGRVRPNSDFLPSDMLDEDGFVRVDDHLRVPGYPNVFAVGDVAATDPHRSSARNWGAFVVTHNLKALAAGRSNRMRRFKAPANRWGSVLGVQADGMVVYQPDGRSFRVPRRLVEPLLYRGFVDRVLYGGLRRDG